MPGFQLSPGVVVDPERGEAYLMSPGGGILAVDLGQGAPVWRTSTADKPLAIEGDLLIGQAEAPGPANSVRIVTLDTGRRGARVAEALIDLPSGVQPMITAQSNRSFSAEARTEPGRAVVVTWQFVERPLRGLDPGPMQVLPGEAPPAAFAGQAPAFGPDDGAPEATAVPEPGGEETVVAGAARVDLSTGTVTSAEAPPAPNLPRFPSLPDGNAFPASELDPGDTLPGVPEPQFLSADGRHVLSSRRVADDPEWDKYLWSLFERENGGRVGEVRMHLRYAPFFVTGTRLIYQAGPYARRRDGDLVEEPLQLSAVELDTGARVWSQPVRDTVDSEPPPP
jgi:hypothetical protein